MRHPTAPSTDTDVTQSLTSIHGVSHIDFEDTRYMSHGFNRTLRIWRTDHRGVRHSIEFNLFARDAEDIQVYGDNPVDAIDESGDHDVLDDIPLPTTRTVPSPTPAVDAGSGLLARLADPTDLLDRSASDIHGDVNDILDRCASNIHGDVNDIHDAQ